MAFASRTISLLTLLTLSDLIGADNFPVYIVTVDNLHIFFGDVQNCTENLHFVNNIMFEANRFAIEYVNRNLLNGTGLELRRWVIDSCYNADHSEQQVDCIFLRADALGIIPKGMCQARKMENNRTACNAFNMNNGLLVAVMGPMSSNTAEQYALFMQKYCIPVLGSVATSEQFDKISRFKYFLRSVPSDKYQVQAIIHLLIKMKWFRVAIVHETSNYGKNFNDHFVEQVKNQSKNDPKICIQENLEVQFHSSNDWSTNLAKLEAADARVILVFMDLIQTKQFFEAVANRWPHGRYQFIGIDAWAEQQDFTENSKPFIVGSITSLQSSPIFEPFREHIMQINLDAAEQVPKPDFCTDIDTFTPIADFIRLQNKCSRNCTGKETLREVTEGTLIRASQEFDNVYIVAKALADFCANETNCETKLGELDGKHFYEMMKGAVINLPNYYFKFLENSGMPQYNFYQYQNTSDGRFIWTNVGYFNVSIKNGTEDYLPELMLNLATNYIGPSFCPEDVTATIVIITCTLVVVMCVIVFILIATLVFKHRQSRNEKTSLQNRIETLNAQNTIDIFPRDAVQIKEELGKGQFGTVMKAYIDQTEIAVKVLHEQTFDKLNDFLDEFVTMLRIGNHPNVLHLLGVVTETTSTSNLMICMEFCEAGSLINLIQREQEKYLDERADVDEYESQSINAELANKRIQSKKNIGYRLMTRDLLSYGYQIANGMCYLGKKGVVHRDLAARNVLVHKGIAKISDYGLAITYGYFRKNDVTVVPFPILAPECLQDPRNVISYTWSSDVWAFGMLLWDIFNLCKQDLYKTWDVTGRENLFEMLSTGKRLEQPTYTTKKLYEFILGCWKFEPEKRPGFKNCKFQMASEMERCAPGSVEGLQKKLKDELKSVKQDSLKEQISKTSKIGQSTIFIAA